MPKLTLISNTSPLLYLGRIEHAHLLPALFDPVYVPEPVLLELDAGRLLRSDTIEMNLISSVRPLLDALQRQGFRLSSELRDEALRLASED